MAMTSTNSMNRSEYNTGNKCEAVDEYGVWFEATVESITDDGYVVSFDGWPADFNVTVGPLEIRPPSPLGRGRRNRKNLHSFRDFLELQRGDQVWCGTTMVTVDVNDPYKLHVKGKCGKTFPYQQLSASPTITKSSSVTSKSNKATSTRKRASSSSVTPRPARAKFQRHETRQTNVSQLSVALQHSNAFLECGELYEVDKDLVFLEKVTVNKANGFRCIEKEGAYCEDAKVCLDLVKMKNTSFVKQPLPKSFAHRSKSCKFATLCSAFYLNSTSDVDRVASRKAAIQRLVRKEIQAITPNGRSRSITCPADTAVDLYIFELTPENNFSRVVYPMLFNRLDSVVGEQWDVKNIPKRGRYLQIVKFAVAVTAKDHLLRITMSYQLSTSEFSQGYRQKYINYSIMDKTD